jgi:hypothetical protein
LYLVETVPKAIEVGIEMFEDDEDFDPVYEAIGILISTLQRAAIEHPAQQPAVLEVLQAIRCLPEQTVQLPVTGDNKSPGTEDIVWSNMPHFASDLSDTYDYQRSLFEKAPSASSTISRWASVNAWIARLASTEINVIGGSVFFLHRASYCFLQALDVEDHPNFEGQVPAAANLFRYASPQLLQLCREEPAPPEPPLGIFNGEAREYIEGRKVLWAGLGYAMNRWTWWKTRWEQLAGAKNLSREIREHAKEASAAMVAAET